MLAAGGAVLGASLAGCTGTKQQTGSYDPVALTAGTQCDACGMVIADHPGPNGEIFYGTERPASHGNPAWFDSLRGCLFPYYFEHARLGWEAAAIYVTDYSTVEYTLTSGGDQVFISAHTGADTFTDARAAFYVVGSDVHGAMGTDLLPFSVRADAEAFSDTHGGEVLGFDDVSPATLER